MAVHYKFKSAKDYNSVAIEGHFISVGHLKEKIFEKKHLGRGTDFDLVVTNAQTNEEYVDEGMLIPKNTSVEIRRVPGYPRKRMIITAPVSEQEEAVKGSSFAGVDPSSMKHAEEFDWDDFGNDVYAIPETVPAVHSSNVLVVQQDNKEEEERKIKALIETSALDWQHQPFDGRSFGRGMGGRGFGRGGFEKQTPPHGYTCHRCKVPGHFIQHCPTNGDPNFDLVTRVKPKSMLMAVSEAAFEKEIEGMPSKTRCDLLPPELHCPLCKQGMNDAVFTSKCCFKSFCDRCIRDHVISKAMCVCGATNVLADDLLPNKTLRDTINRFLESNNNNSSDDKVVGSSLTQVQDMESRNPQANEVPPSADNVEENKHSNLSEVTNVKEGASPLADAQDFPPENYTMPFAPCAFNPYNNWNGFMPPYGGPMPYMGGYGINPMDVTSGGLPFGCMLPYGPPQPHKKSDHRRSRDVENYDSSAPKKRKLSNGHHHEEHKHWGREKVVRTLLV